MSHFARWPRTRSFLLALLAVGLPVAAAFAAGADYLDPEQAFRGQARSMDGQTIELRIDVAPDYHLYREPPIRPSAGTVNPCRGVNG